MDEHKNTLAVIATAIPYVNARPHLGFALELAIADVLVRHARLRKRRVVALSGTDDHSLKNVLAAERVGQPVADFVLSNYSTTERAELPFQVGDAADAVVTLVTEGLDKTQSRFNS